MNLRDLSKHLNLSQTTVSRALNGYPEVNAKTRQRVQDAATRFNYRPNVRARTLATGRSMSIGHVIPVSRQNEIGNIVFADFIAGAGTVYAQHGYTMALTIVQDDDEMAAYKRITESGAVDGVIVQSPISNDPRITYLGGLELPFVVHGRASGVSAPYLWLDVNNKRAIATATKHLIDLGHRRISLVNGLERMDFALRRRAGFTGALERDGIPVERHLMRSGEMSEPNGYEAAHELLDGPNPPTAFVASSIVLALGIKRATSERGLRPGVDISIICFDDDISYLPNAGPEPLFTAVKSSVRAAGARCAELLMSQIQQPGKLIPSELWDAELVLGRSTGPAPKTKG